MDFSAANTGLWNVIIQLGIIAAAVLVANILRRKLPFVRNTLLPTAVLAGFILLILRSVGWLKLDSNFLEKLTYHGIAIGFIAMSMRVGKNDREKGSFTGPKSGALIASCYVIQGILGLAISLVLAYTFMPGLFKASGILLPMGYGQGPGQANNVGTTYEGLGFVGGRSFALAIAAAGYLCACIVGVIFINIAAKRGKIKRVSYTDMQEYATVDTFQDKGEIPISESIDRFSFQIVLVLLVYLATFLISWGITSLFSAYAPGLAKTVNSLLWGFNFIIGSAIAMLVNATLRGFRKRGIIKHQYQNNYLLSRISGFAFDIMIVAGIASINIEDISGLWVPFVIMAVLGGAVTLLYLMWISKKLYKDYYYEGMLSMYGMMTGTISSGVLLLREVDPEFKTPAANNLILGSSFAIVFGAPILLLVGIAPNSPIMTFITLGILVVYAALLLLFMLKVGTKRTKSGKSDAEACDASETCADIEATSAQPDGPDAGEQ